MSAVWGIVVAGGTGDRFGGQKQFQLLGGEPLWEWARRALIDGGAASVVLVSDREGAAPAGPRRRDSVASGLAEVPPDIEYVLIHDAARPLASPDLISRVIERLLHGDVDGVVPAVPLRDAVKRVQGDVVQAAVDRQGLSVVQTPQGFRAAVLRRAHEDHDVDAADDAELVMAAGGRVVTVPGEITNIKVTYPDDLRLVEAIHAG